MEQNSNKFVLDIGAIITKFKEFLQSNTIGGFLLIISAVIAIIWANSPWSASYFAIWESYLTIGIGEFTLSKSLLHWINDGLMVIFFFFVGLEIKRELLVGELSSFSKAALPIIAAIGGMVIPAIFYLVLNWNTEYVRGWGIPVATDIAFAIGVLAMLGKRVPIAMKVFLTALAIVDDIGAVLIIALFYTSELSIISLAFGAAIIIILIVINALGVKKPAIYIILGIFLWYAFLKSGVHATVAGVLLAMTIPVKSKIRKDEFLSKTKPYIDELESKGSDNPDEYFVKNEQDVFGNIGELSLDVQSPLYRIEHILAKYVAFLVMPIFALANAGVVIDAETLASAFGSVSIGIFLGLTLGKQIGIFSFSYLAVKFGWATLPSKVSWQQVYGVSMLCGIGFTMSLFISMLAFDNPSAIVQSKIGIFSASIVAGLMGYFWIRFTTKVKT